MKALPYYEVNDERLTIMLSLDDIHKKNKVEWRKECHQLWNFENKEEIDEVILTVLLVSKHRKESSFVGTKLLVKGITMYIIKFICHLNQKIVN